MTPGQLILLSLIFPSKVTPKFQPHTARAPGQSLGGSYHHTLSTWGISASEDPETREVNNFLLHTQGYMEQKQENDRKQA